MASTIQITFDAADPDKLVPHVVAATTMHENGVAIGDQVVSHWCCEPDS